MIRKLMASSAIAALMAAGLTIAQAQTEPVEEPALVEEQAPADAATTEVAESEDKLTPDQPTLATAFIGKAVYSSEDPESDNIGDVNDLIVSDDGSITHAVIGVGGFLGIGEKDVAVPFDELQVVEQDGEIRLVYASTREQLEAAEAFDRTAYDPSARFAEEQAAMQPDATATDPLAPAPEADTAMTEPVEEPADTAATEPEPAMEEPADTAATEPETEEPADTAATEPAPETEEQADTAATEPTTEEPATTEMAETTEPAANAEQIETAATGEAEGFISFDAEQMRASTLMGKEVFGPDEESIGEVSDLVLQEDGETRAALIDVGGFLGVGEKRVAIPFENIEVSQPAEDGGEPRLTVAMSREELEALPAFEDRTMGAEETAATEPAEAPADDTAVTEAPADSADQDLVAEGAEPAAEGTAAFELATQDLTAEELIGSPVYGSDEENLGEVGDVVFASGGEIEAVVIDVGGFLGIGEKPVAVQFDSLNVQKDVNGDMQLMIQATQEQLENAPTYEDETAALQ